MATLAVEQAKASPAAIKEPSQNSTRRKGLIEEAEMRAEQQALARVTMLDLARELEEASKNRRRAEMELVEERQKNSRLQAALVEYKTDLQKAHKETEDAKVCHMKDKLVSGTRTGVMTAGLLLWSRQAIPIDRVGEGITDAQQTSITFAEADEPEVEDPEWPKDTSGKLLAVEGRRSKGDGLMLLWILRGWKEQVEELKRQRLQDSENASKLKALRAEMDRMREMFEKQLAEERAKNRALEQRIAALLDEIEKLKARCDQLEREKAELLKQLRPGGADAGPYEELLEKYRKLKEMYDSKEAECEHLKQTIRELEAMLAREREESKAEIARLKAQIRELSAELQRQIVFAKHLRDVALKAKRDAASSISPEKFAQLITELEDMRDRLNVLGAENDKEKEQTKMLGLKLDQNKRRLELERQFLPLLHKVRGPVGPKNPLFQKNMAAMAAAAMVTDEMGPLSPDRRMAHSQSAGAIDAMAASSTARPRQDGRGGAGGHRLQGGGF